jgi:hypothetical protein
MNPTLLLLAAGVVALLIFRSKGSAKPGGSSGAAPAAGGLPQITLPFGLGTVNTNTFLPSRSGQTAAAWNTAAAPAAGLLNSLFGLFKSSPSTAKTSAPSSGSGNAEEDAWVANYWEELANANNSDTYWNSGDYWADY